VLVEGLNRTGATRAETSAESRRRVARRRLGAASHRDRVNLMNNSAGDRGSAFAADQAPRTSRARAVARPRSQSLRQPDRRHILYRLLRESERVDAASCRGSSSCRGADRASVDCWARAFHDRRAQLPLDGGNVEAVPEHTTRPSARWRVTLQDAPVLGGPFASKILLYELYEPRNPLQP